MEIAVYAEQCSYSCMLRFVSQFPKLLFEFHHIERSVRLSQPNECFFPGTEKFPERPFVCQEERRGNENRIIRNEAQAINDLHPHTQFQMADAGI